MGERAHQCRPRSVCGAANDRRAGAGGRSKPLGADGADRVEGLRQLHVYAHGERVDPHDGTGARPGRRRSDAARVRACRAHARHRQGEDAGRDPEQAGQADRRRIHHHEAAHRRRRRDASRHAGDSRACAGRRLRASLAARRHRIPAWGVAADPEPRDHAVRHCRRVRRDAIPA